MRSFASCCCQENAKHDNTSAVCSGPMYEETVDSEKRGSLLLTPHHTAAPQFQSVGALPVLHDTPQTHSITSSPLPTFPDQISAEDVGREKFRLQGLLKEFAKQAVTGIEVRHVIDLQTVESVRRLFILDQSLTRFALTGTTSLAAQAFEVQDLINISRGPDAAERVPSLGLEGHRCVCIETADSKCLLYFDADYDRENFYTCLNILRLARKQKK